MRPELFRIYDIGFPAYFVLLLTGFVFATAVGALWARRIGRDPDVIVDLGLSCLLAGVVGARLLHVVADGHFLEYVHLCTDRSKVVWHISRNACAEVHKGGWLEALGLDSTHPTGQWDEALGACHPLTANCFAWAEFYNGGLTYYGGLVVASLWAVHALRRDRFPFWKAADMAGFAVPIGLCFGRMGCLLAGCCFGIQSTSRFALSFPPHSPATEAEFKAGELASLDQWSKPVLPMQIFESAMCLTIAAVCLFWVHGRKRYDGQVFATFLALYAVGRFVLEFWRDDDSRGLLESFDLPVDWHRACRPGGGDPPDSTAPGAGDGTGRGQCPVDVTPGALSAGRLEVEHAPSEPYALFMLSLRPVCRRNGGRCGHRLPTRERRVRDAWELLPWRELRAHIGHREQPRVHARCGERGKRWWGLRRGDGNGGPDHVAQLR